MIPLDAPPLTVPAVPDDDAKAATADLLARVIEKINDT